MRIRNTRKSDWSRITEIGVDAPCLAATTMIEISGNPYSPRITDYAHTTMRTSSKIKADQGMSKKHDIGPCGLLVHERHETEAPDHSQAEYQCYIFHRSRHKLGASFMVAEDEHLLPGYWKRHPLNAPQFLGLHAARSRNRQLQRLAQRHQVLLARTGAISFPMINACGRNTHALSEIGYSHATSEARIPDVIAKADLSGQCTNPTQLFRFAVFLRSPNRSLI